MNTAAGAQECVGCSQGFTFLKTPHLCRNCNLFFCHGCSSGKRAIPDKGHHDPVRVCDVCLYAVDTRSRLSSTRSVSADSTKVADGPLTRALFIDEATLHMQAAHEETMSALKRIYKAKIRPLEQAFKFSEFYDSELTDGDFDAKPVVLLIGQYSVGKTTFIQYLLERSDVPGSRVGPEPTTDRFVAVMAGRPGQGDTIVPGNAAAVDLDRPFSSLSRFGTSFLSKFQVSEVSSPILDMISFIDTPGILSGSKQTMDRGYSFEAVVEWFAARADRILLLFDAHKLDISDEFKRVIESLKAHDDKIRVVLNKADMVSSQQLMRVYGALMWSLGKVVRTPEVLRVYIGSFWNEPINETGKENQALFSAEESDLLKDLRGLPRNSAVRKINELVKRARLAKVHALLVTHLRNNMPMLWGHKSKQDKLASRLEQEYIRVQKANNLAIGDFPSTTRFRAGLSAFELSEFPTISKRMLSVADGALARDIPSLLLSLGESVDGYAAAVAADLASNESLNANPFAERASSLQSCKDEEGSESESGCQNETVPWVIGATAKEKWDGVFENLGPSGEPPSVTGNDVRTTMLKSGLPASALKRIWDLADVDKDGRLDAEEFAVAMQLIKIACSEGCSSIPESLPRSFIPPSKR